MLSEISETEKDKYCIVLVHEICNEKKTNKLIETEERLVVARARELGSG